MRVEELRIGSILNYKGKSFKMLEISQSRLKAQSNKGLVLFEVSELEPMELTEEILLSIEGVKQLNEWQYKLNDWFIIERYTTKEKWSVRKVISEDSSILLCFVDFLHELQNITFSLTNKELEINL